MKKQNNNYLYKRNVITKSDFLLQFFVQQCSGLILNSEKTTCFQPKIKSPMIQDANRWMFKKWPSEITF